MMYKCHPIQYYDFSSADRLLLDTNIWIYIFGLTGHTRKEEKELYSNAFKRILAAKSCIYTSTLIISELINVCARLTWRQGYKTTYPDFKRFRQSPEFKPIAEDIAASVRLTIKHCKMVGNNLNHTDVRSLIDEYAKGNSDFNDQVFVRICQSENLMLVTHDADFLNQSVTLISGNRKLIKSSSSSSPVS